MSCHCDNLCLQQFSSNTTLGPEFLAKQFQLKPRGNTMSFHDPLNESKWAFCDSFTEITMLDTWHKLDQIQQGNVIDEACLDQSQNIWLREYLNLCKLITDTIACFPSMSIISVVWLGINLIIFTVQVPHDDVMKWKHFLGYWPCMQEIHWSQVNSPHKGQWHRALIFLWSAPVQMIE